MGEGARFLQGAIIVVLPPAVERLFGVCIDLKLIDRISGNHVQAFFIDRERVLNGLTLFR